MNEFLLAYWKPSMVAAVSATLVAGLGAAATHIGPWYESLRKPSWQPPDWLFGPAWTTIFALTAISGVMAWTRADQAANREQIVATFAANGVLNILWSVLFFHLRRPDWALIEVAALWVSIVAIIWAAGTVDITAGWLLAPYLVWVTFAAVLNLMIVRLNAPFA